MAPNTVGPWCVPGGGGADEVPGAPTDCLSIHGCVFVVDDTFTGCSQGAGAGVAATATFVAVEITGFSPSCCMNELYSSSMAAVSAADFFFCVQSRVGWLESPQIAHLTPAALKFSVTTCHTNIHIKGSVHHSQSLVVHIRRQTEKYNTYALGSDTPTACGLSRHRCGRNHHRAACR